MSHPVDKLFKDKLTDLEIPVSADAWQRVQLHRKKSKFMFYQKWTGIAATMMLLIASVFIVTKNSLDVKGSKTQTEEIAANESPISTEPTPLLEEEEEEVKDDKVAAKQPVNAQALQPQKVMEKPKVQQSTNQENADKSVAKVPAETMRTQSELPELPVKMSAVATVEIPDAPQVVFEKVTLPQLNTNPENQESLFDKIANTAREIKNNEGMMAELREFKDEVVSLEFFKTKKSI